MPEITQIKVKNIIYDIRDATARARNIPSGGTTGQIIKKKSNTDYDVEWVNETGAPDWSDVQNKPSTFPPSDHNHDDRYYTESEIDTALSTKAPLASPALTGTPTAPTAADGTNTTQIATTQFVQNAFKANDAMVFKGTIGSSGATVTTLPTTHYQGWTYKVITAGSYVGTTCEIGDMIICVTDGTSANNAHWTVVQSNIDGAVIGPVSATDGRIAVFNGTSGKVIKDSGYTIAKSVPSDAKFTDTKYNASTTTVGSASAGTAIKAHNISSWSTGTLPTLGTNIKINNITSWSTGTLPTLGTAIPADDITAWSTGTLPTLGVSISTDDITAWSTGTLPTLGSAIKADDITAWSTGTLPTLGTAIKVNEVSSWSTGTLPTLGTAIKADDITAWSTGVLPSATVSGENLTLNFGTLPSLTYSEKTIPNVTGVGTLPSLGQNEKSIPNITNVGTLPSLTYNEKTIPNVTGVGTLPSLSYTEKAIPNVTSVGTLPNLTYTAKSIPNVTNTGTLPNLQYSETTIPNITNVGTLPDLQYSEKTIPNITVTSKTVVTGISESA